MSLYTPFTSPPKLPHARYARPTATLADGAKWGGPPIAKTCATARSSNRGSDLR